jgi:hypothetical protein
VKEPVPGFVKFVQRLDRAIGLEVFP